MRRLIVLLVLLLAGCVTEVDRALDATALAEKRIGKSGSAALTEIARLSSSLTTTSDGVAALVTALGRTSEHVSGALDGVAALTTSLSGTMAHVSSAVDAAAGVIAEARPAMKEVTGILTELHAATANARETIESGALTRKLLYGLAAGLVLVLLHSVYVAWRTKKHIAAMHEDVRGLRRGL